MIKLGKSEVLRGEIIRPVCKCKLLRNFLPSPPFRARYFWQIFRECECGEVSANVREKTGDRKIFIHERERISEITYDSYEERTERSRQKEIKKEHADTRSGPARSDVRLDKKRYRKKRERERKRKRERERKKKNREAGNAHIKNGRYHKCHYPSNPSATENMRNSECRTVNFGQSCLTENWIILILPSLPIYVCV